MQLCTHVTGCVCSNNSNCNRQNKSNTEYFNLYAEFRFLYFISTPSNHLLLHFWFYLRYKNKYVLFDFYFAKFNFLRFISTPSNRSPICVWFYLRYKNKYVLFDFYFAKFNFLCFISTPSNRSPICVWFYLRYKNKKNYTKLSVVLSGCFEGCEFPLSFSSQFFFYCWIETCCLEILHQLCTGLFPVPVMDSPRFSCSLCCACSWFLRLRRFI